MPYAITQLQNINSTAFATPATDGHDAVAGKENGGDGWLLGKDGFSFHQILSILNPLQQLPVISTIYRAITGEEISPAERILGGLLYGGPIGLAFGAADSAFQEIVGKDPGQMMLAMFTGDDDEPNAVTSGKNGVLANADQSLATQNHEQSASILTADPAFSIVNSPQSPIFTASADGMINNTAGLKATLTSIETTALDGTKTPVTPAVPIDAAAPATAATAAIALDQTLAAPIQLAEVPAATNVAPPPLEQSAKPIVLAQAQLVPPSIPASVNTGTATPVSPPTAPIPITGNTINGQRSFPVPGRSNNALQRLPVMTNRTELNHPGTAGPQVINRSAYPPISAATQSISAAPAASVAANPDRPASSNPAPQPQTTTSPLAATHTATAQPTPTPFLPPGDSIPDAMKNALDKYEALLKSRKGATSRDQTS